MRPVQFYIDAALYKRLLDFASDTGTSASQIIRDLVTDFLENPPPETERVCFP